MTYKEMITKLRNNENFSFSRFGDGEINCILGAQGGQNQLYNCDKHQYFKSLGMALYKVLESKPKYIMGLQGLAQRLRKGDKYFNDLISGIDWVDSDIIHHASLDNGIDDLIDSIKGRSVVLIGNFHMAEIALKYDFDFGHIVVSEVDCWLEYNEVKKRLLEYVEEDDIVLYCASMMSEVLIDDLYNYFGDTITQIDIGSAFDPYIGRVTRSYHKKIIK